MRYTDLEDWLSWQETLHPRAVDLSLERVRRVAMRLDLLPVPYRVITVGGTNGKGSCAMLAAELLAGHGAVGLYTSPHLWRYNERVSVDGRPCADQELVAAFDAIDGARGDDTLTYFEFGTLAALEIFRRREVESAVLEVGLGGRLDAVNIVDSDVSVVTSVDIDHARWLGPDRESIGAEKGGIFRAGRPAIIGDRRPPKSLLRAAADCGARTHLPGRDFGWSETVPGAWAWWSAGARLDALPRGPLVVPALLDNAACALEAVRLIAPDRLAGASDALARLKLPGRLQRVAGKPEWLLDVAHNPAAAAVLAAALGSLAAGRRVHLVLGMMRDKDLGGVIAGLRSSVDLWYACGVDDARGLSGPELAAALVENGVAEDCVTVAAAPLQACAMARQAAAADDLVVVAGSFLVVGPAGHWLGVYSPPADARTA